MRRVNEGTSFEWRAALWREERTSLLLHTFGQFFDTYKELLPISVAL